MSKEPIRTDQAPQPGGAYSQGMRVGNLVFVSSQGPGDPQTGKLAGDTIEEQTAQTLKNVLAILAAAGATPADVVKVTVYLSDLSLFARYNAVYTSMFPDPKPARTTVGSILPTGMLIVIDAIAQIGAGAE